MGLLHDDSFIVQVMVDGAWVYIHAPFSRDPYGRPVPWSLVKDRRVALGIKDPVGGRSVAARAVDKGLIRAGAPWRVVAEGWRGERVVAEGRAGLGT